MTSETTSSGPVAPAIEPIVHGEAALRSRVLYVLTRLVAKQLYRLWPLNNAGVRALALLEAVFGLLPPPSSVDCTRTTLGSVPAERYTPVTPSDGPLTGTCVLYLHGGGFTFCGIGTHRRLTSSMATELSVPVYSLAYRQLPHGGPGSAVRDAMAAYRELLTAYPEPARIIVAGDSSGAFLAGKICELAAADGLPLPAAYVGYSAHIDLDADHRGPEAIGHDALMPVSAYRRAKRRWAGDPVPLRGTRSLLRVDPTAFPPAFLTAGEHEMFEADILDFTDRLARAGQAVETHVWHRQVHAFPALDRLLPESREAMQATVRFLRSRVGERDSTAIN